MQREREQSSKKVLNAQRTKTGKSHAAKMQSVGTVGQVDIVNAAQFHVYELYLLIFICRIV